MDAEAPAEVNVVAVRIIVVELVALAVQPNAAVALVHLSSFMLWT